MNRSGFTLVEVVVSLVILAVGILGISTSVSRLSLTSATVEQRAVALQAAQDRISLILLHPRYGELDSLFSATETDLPGLEGFTRTTFITRIQTPGTGGRVVDFTRITVSVDGALLTSPVTQTVMVAAK